MTDPTEDLFSGLDRPRPLPAELRRRLEEQLLAGAEDPVDVPLGAELDERLRAALVDPVAATLAGIDAPLSLDAALRARLEQRLIRRPRRARALLGVAAAVVVAAGAVALVVAPASSHRPPTQEAAAPRAPGPVGASALSRQPQSVGGAGVGTGGGSLSAKATGRVPAPVSGAQSDMQFGATYDETASAPPALEPSAGPVGGGTAVTLRGGGLGSAVEVLFGPARASLRVLSDSEVRVVTPAAAHAGTVDVVVRLASGATSTYRAAFRYVTTETGPRHPSAA